MPINAIRRKEVFEMMPEGVVATRAWLMEKGLSRHAIDNLVKSRQLESISKGIYIRGTSKITWQSIVYTLQAFLKLDLVIGGLTALEMQGFSHYLSLSKKKVIHLFGNDKMPGWVNQLIPDITFIWHSDHDLLGGRSTRKPINFNGSNLLRSFTVERDWKENVGNLILSSPERAYLEMLLDVPQKVSFEHADQMMQGLTTLSPRSLQELLELCQNIKVRRLFFWLADRHNYNWLTKINPNNIDMGSGNRMLIKGGRLNKKYKITVPQSL